MEKINSTEQIDIQKQEQIKKQFEKPWLMPLIIQPKLRIHDNSEGLMDIIFANEKQWQNQLHNLIENAKKEEKWVFVEDYKVWVETWLITTWNHNIQWEQNIKFLYRFKWKSFSTYHIHPDINMKIKFLKSIKSQWISITKKNIKDNLSSLYDIYPPSPDDFLASYYIWLYKWVKWKSKLVCIFGTFEYWYDFNESMDHNKNKIFKPLIKIQDRLRIWEINETEYNKEIKLFLAELHIIFKEKYLQYRSMQFKNPKLFCENMTKEWFYMKFTPFYPINKIEKVAIDRIWNKFNQKN